MRALKILAIAVGGLIALLVLVLLGVWLFVDPNHYKGTITRAVRDSTGRELALPGDIKLSVFPWIALELGPASLGNPSGFGSAPFASLQHASVRVRLLPLLRREIEIGRVEVDGLDLRLVKNATGKGNWEGFGGKSSAPQAPAGSTALPELAGLALRNSRISYQDMVAEHIDMTVGRVSPGVAVPIDAKLDLTTGPGAQPLALAGNLNVTLDTAKQQYRIAPLHLEGTVPSKPPASALAWKFSAPDVSLNLSAQTLSAPTFDAQFANAHVSGGLQGRKIVDSPNISGSFKLDAVALRELMTQLGTAAPAMRDAQALDKLAGSGEFSYGGNALRATKLDVRLDDSTLTGNAAITNLDTKAMSFELALDRINLDRYRAPVTAAPKAAPPKAPAKPTELPNATLKSLQLKGTATIGSLTVSGMNLTQVHVGIDSDGGVTRVAPAKARLYGGEYSGEVTLDERGSVPTLKLDQTMGGIDIAQLLKDFAKTQRFSGHGTVTTNLTAHGDDSDAMTRSLSGRVTANLADGAVEGIDLWFEVNRAIALLQKQVPPAGGGSGRTKFDSFKASADVTNGVATTKDLNIASQSLHVTGQGSSNLVSEAIDYQVKATLFKGAPAANAASASVLAEVPLNISGTMSSPKVRPDLEAMARSRVQQELEKHKGELQQKLQDKLKQFFK